ncbi:hypothetical protein P9E76_05815 [Schinkia azotoformans]|uniref:Uncharacterized protein n=1 Tax=Schinkia azotoformans LMG 9581 TaxID=1131731 RepID=K6CUX8_SCHAZ|nr:hypothetical protein [Schinkia azotoformans]EKN64012.1 hypothetical protein BAZO_15164 [Schinkia azotoformans LMG 9581]MEC1640554.1 hypothetical protein [Schinkia azotoformans]MEC1719431.1 hypothetical protein [Schinkia azotoformans]MEC1944561.1 hypothetical protein [Schinkia azotoformans]MED4353427.1 hypothetical protein [Schinkia azotoformans]
MIIAIVIDKDEKIVPIVEGEKIRIYDTETNEYQEFPNPALALEEGRRGSTLKFVEQKGATAFAAPPQTFCELSYEKAIEDQIKFFHLPLGLFFSQFKEQVDQKRIDSKGVLPRNEIAPSFIL